MVPSFIISVQYTKGLSTKREGKLVVYWPRSFSFRVYGTEEESRSLISQKKKKPISSLLTEQAWPIKDLLCG